MAEAMHGQCVAATRRTVNSAYPPVIGGEVALRRLRLIFPLPPSLTRIPHHGKAGEKMCVDI